MPFGLCNAPAKLERLMETVLRGLTSEACLVYLDDIIIVARTFEEHLNNIRKVQRSADSSERREAEGQIARWIQRLQEYDFKIQHRKGTSHGDEDAFSRSPCKESCKHCTNAEKKFGRKQRFP
ncbi:hypothetical protein AVEN_259566-1 [Araneus ventricosus]|uniref:Reverse transcriptase domain-containing protein n=1 Tax=Araneus ventricosus TaxID=182803 RepID=A0A4Y2EQS1_ARAVE|nr:hypothetical protein AVEN_259566-1 [Araneus ventricosus]